MSAGRAFVAALVVAFAHPASAIVKCRTADGKVRFVDVAPAGCTVEGEYESAPEREEPGQSQVGTPTDDSRASAAVLGHAIPKRRELERKADEIGRGMRRLQQQMESTPLLSGPVSFSSNADGAIAYYQERIRREELHAGWKEQRTALEEQLGAIVLEFTALTAEVAAAHGGAAPPSWSPGLRCRECP